MVDPGGARSGAAVLLRLLHLLAFSSGGSASGTRLRLGGVPYGVGEPLVRGLVAMPDVALARAVPRDLIAALRAGDLDAALVSSIEAFRTPGYAALADLGIACKTQARSVRAFKTPRVPVARVGVDDGSETSVALLHILLRDKFGAGACTFERVTPRLDVDAYPHDLVLLIGDHGLRARTAAREPIDLGAAWRELTGLPFVFALWLIAPHADRARVADALRRAAGPGPLHDATNGAIHYRLDDDDHRGLRHFAQQARALGLAPDGIEPVFLPPCPRANA
jgi:chorismate dehydratase